MRKKLLVEPDHKWAHFALRDKANGITDTAWNSYT